MISTVKATMHKVVGALADDLLPPPPVPCNNTVWPAISFACSIIAFQTVTPAQGRVWDFLRNRWIENSLSRGHSADGSRRELARSAADSICSNSHGKQPAARRRGRSPDQDHR